MDERDGAQNPGLGFTGCRIYQPYALYPAPYTLLQPRQYGAVPSFREDHRCKDDLLALRTLIEQQVSGKGQLYACYVDFNGAYETIKRELMRQKLAN